MELSLSVQAPRVRISSVRLPHLELLYMRAVTGLSKVKPVWAVNLNSDLQWTCLLSWPTLPAVIIIQTCAKVKKNFSWIFKDMHYSTMW